MKINKKGFTLIELLVVIAIIGLLSTLAVVSLNNARLKARDAKRMSDLKQISTAMELYSSDQGTSAYPTNAAGAETCADTPTSNIIAAADNGAAIDNLCGSNNAITDGTDTFLQAIPADPVSSANYHYEGSATTYCISAHLEKTGTPYFVCVNGSCYERTTDCTEAGG
ncbi:type II secretion system protein [Candidatus Parcubacteria bacterium]|nr:type II secretion system protein [Candidatus Parcubacteria bacterium]